MEESKYLDEILNIIKGTPNTPDGIKIIVDAVEERLNVIDSELQDFVAQRNMLGKLLQQYIELYRAFSGQELMSDRELDNKQKIPYTAISEDELRELVLKTAEDGLILSSNNMVVDNTIWSMLKTRGYTLPWSNPKAVISTILYHSDLWKKIDTGKFKWIGPKKEEIL